MKDLHVQPESQRATDEANQAKSAHAPKPEWETPKLEDVSDEVMAQPYIRFT